MEIKKMIWGEKGGKEIYLVTFNNGVMEVSFSNLGCTITHINVPDGSGKMKNIILGYDDLDGYLNDTFYMGCIVGRVSGRISNVSFDIDGKKYELTKNDHGSDNHLHGGFEGFNKKVFDLLHVSKSEHSAIAEFYYNSEDMEEGYPGNADIFVTYTLTDKNELRIEYGAVSDKATHINLTNHCYFNLSGKIQPALLQELFVDAHRFVQCGQGYIPTGELRSVNNDPHDFRNKHIIDHGGFNECFVLNGNTLDEKIKAELSDPASGTTMSIKTTLPGIVLYTGDYLNGPFKKNQGVCLETQFFPDTPNRKEFPSTLLLPGQEYKHTTTLGFSF
jgi:aldose 1-epimerase